MLFVDETVSSGGYVFATGVPRTWEPAAGHDSWRQRKSMQGARR